MHSARPGSTSPISYPYQKPSIFLPSIFQSAFNTPKFDLTSSCYLLLARARQPTSADAVHVPYSGLTPTDTHYRLSPRLLLAVEAQFLGITKSRPPVAPNTTNMENATSFTSPLATVRGAAANVPWQLDYVVDAVSNASGWQIVLTILALLVAYDQCTSLQRPVDEVDTESEERVDKKANENCDQTPTSGTRAPSKAR